MPRSRAIWAMDFPLVCTNCTASSLSSFVKVRSRLLHDLFPFCVEISFSSLPPPLLRVKTKDNRLWGAERIRGELLKLGIHVCKRTIQKYMRGVRTHQPRGQKWCDLSAQSRRHIWACDSLQVTDLFFRPLAGLLPHRTEITKGHPCGRDTLADRCLGGATTARSHALWASTELSHS